MPKHGLWGSARGAPPNSERASLLPALQLLAYPLLSLRISLNIFESSEEQAGGQETADPGHRAVAGLAGRPGAPQLRETGGCRS